MLEQQAAIFREDLHHLQPVVASAKSEALKTQAVPTIHKAELSKAKDKTMAKTKDEGEARKAKARKDAEPMADEILKGLMCLWCNRQLQSITRIPRYCTKNMDFLEIVVAYELHLESCCATKSELVEAIVKE